MTENEAIERIKTGICCEKGTARYCTDACMYGKEKCAYSVAIKALEEIQQYRTIGTVEECRAAMEKQTAKKPKKTESEGYRYTDTYRCPNCGGNFSGTGIADYCYHCGQKLDWEGEVLFVLIQLL